MNKRRRQNTVRPVARATAGAFIAGHERAVTIALLLVNLLLCLLLFEPKLHTGGDNASYIILSESIFRRGDGYSDTIVPGPPQPHTQYPFGYPLLLAPLVLLFGRSYIVLKLLSVSFSVLSVLAFIRLSRRLYQTPLHWAALALAFALNPLVIDYSHWILSEISFLLFSLLALNLFFRSEDDPRPGRWFWLSLGSIVFVYYLRSIGITLIGAAFLSYVIWTRWRKAIVFAGGAAVLFLPWFIRNKLVRGDVTPYLNQFLMKNVYDPESGLVGLSGMARRVVDNVWIYSWRELPRVFLGSESELTFNPVIRSFGLLLAVVLLVGLIRHLVHRPRILEIYFIFNMIAVLLFEEVVSDVRYLLPLAPIILYYLFDGMTVLAGKLVRPRLAATLTVSLLLLLGGSSLLAQLARVPSNLALIGRYMHGNRYAGYPPAFVNFFQAADWIAANTPDSSFVTARKPSLLHLHTGRFAQIYPFSTDTDSVLAVVLKSDYVIVDAVSGTTFRYLVPALKQAPDKFRVAWQAPAQPFTAVLEVVR